MDEQKIYRAALAAWGADAQTLMVFEEMSEPQKELCKAARGAVLRKGVTVTQAARKLNRYEETGLTPQGVFDLIERAHNLEQRVKTLEDWL